MANSDQNREGSGVGSEAPSITGERGAGECDFDSNPGLLADLREMRENVISDGWQARRHRSFGLNCALAYVLRSDRPLFQQKVVREAFGISAEVTSRLAHVFDDPDKRHFSRVRAEWEKLGPEKFAVRYFTPTIRTALKTTRLKMLGYETPSAGYE